MCISCPSQSAQLQVNRLESRVEQGERDLRAVERAKEEDALHYQRLEGQLKQQLRGSPLLKHTFTGEVCYIYLHAHDIYMHAPK